MEIQGLLERDQGALAALYRHASELRVFQKKLKAKLPPPLCDQFVLANIDGDTLTLHTDSAAWAARLRFLTPNILQSVRELCGTNSPQTIRIRVVPPVSQSPSLKRPMHLSSENVQLIKDTAISITDPVLKASLNKLAHGKS